MAINQRWVWGGIAVGGAGIAIYMYRRNKASQAGAASATDTSGTDASGTDPNATGQYYDPAGYGYGPYGLADYGSYGQDSGMGFYGAGTGVPVQVPQQATTDAQWAQAAVSALSAAGYDAQAVLAALGIYLTDGNLTQDQAAIVSAAIAAEGYPPVPHTMHVGGGGGSGQGGGGGTTPANGIMVPDVVGKRLAVATGILKQAGLREGGASQIKGRSQTVITQNPSAGTSVTPGSMVTLRTR